ncbi:unnamed protein product, partial [Tetraodon nigroviridis]
FNSSSVPGDPRVLLPPRDVCQCQQLQPGSDGGWHSGLRCGAAPLGQEPRGVCAHKSPGEKFSYLNTIWKSAKLFSSFVYTSALYTVNLHAFLFLPPFLFVLPPQYSAWKS